MNTSNRIILLLAAALLSFTANAQQPVANSKFVVFFTDKNNSPFSISSPTQYLSQRAIDRRNRYGIAIDEKDLPVNQTYVDGVRNAGVFILNKSKWLNCVTVWAPDTTVLAAIRALPYVQNLKPISKVKPNEDPLANLAKVHTPKTRTKSTEKSTGTPLDYGRGFNQINLSKGQTLHQNGFKGEGMVIAVLDAGFSQVNQMDMFDSLWVYNRILGTKDYVNPGNHDVFQFNTHGTYVLSTMGGNIPGVLVGTAPRASYWLIRTEEAASENIIEEYNWASGAEFADSVGADVINSSLGYTLFDDTTQSHTYADMDGKKNPSSRAATIAAGRGLLVLNSAGNSGSGSWFYLGAPADADSILTIGAVDSLGNYANFSSKGPSYDKRIKPNVAAQGSNAWVVNFGGGASKASGTSFSSPIMAGMVTCFWQANPVYNNIQIMDAVQKSASQHNNPDSLLGYGIPDFSIAGQLLTSTTFAGQTKKEIVNIFPNPFQSTFNIVYQSVKSKQIEVLVTDISGRKVLTEKFTVTPGEVSTIILTGMENQPAGQYIVSVKGAGKQRFSKTLIKQ